tara:strand:+ start:3628 stop:3930 length:303 start_codon:yes stop_codon:yes gene_type:complete
VLSKDFSRRFLVHIVEKNLHQRCSELKSGKITKKCVACDTSEVSNGGVERFANGTTTRGYEATARLLEEIEKFASHCGILVEHWRDQLVDCVVLNAQLKH